MDKKTYTKKNVNYAFKIVGFLGHNNNIFDRVCEGECKRMYFSREHPDNTCPNCGGKLTYIRSADNVPMSVSEGTIYPAFGPKQESHDLDAIIRRKNGMRPVYRFKMFNFMDEHGFLDAPEEHSRCKRGAKVEIVTVNHQLVPSLFETKPKDGSPSELRVELLIMLYENYGDRIKILTDAEYSDKTHPYSVYKDGTPVPLVLDDDDAKIAAMEASIAEIKANKARTATRTASTPPPPPKMAPDKAMAVNVAGEPIPVPWNDDDDYDMYNQF